MLYPSPNSTLKKSELSDLIELFLSELPLRLSVIEQLAGAGDREGLMRSAHQLKSAAGSYGYGDLSLYAGRLEALCRNRLASIEQLERAVDELNSVANCAA